MGKEVQTRRRVLQLSSGALVAGLAGCSGAVSDDENPGKENGTEESNSSQTESEEPDDDTEEAEAENETEDQEDEAESGGEGEDGETETEDGDDPEEEEEADPAEEFDIEEPPGAFAEIPIPDDPGSYQYPIAGTGDAPVRVRLFGGWKCRHTRAFLLGRFEDFVDEYVRTGKVDIAFHGVPYRNGSKFHGDDGPRAARAGLAVWYSEPDVFWSYLEYMYTNMETGDGWATTDRLQAIASEAGVEDHEQFASTVESGAFETQLEETMEYVKELPVNAVPRFGIEGEPYSPNASPQETREALQAAYESASE